jgi:hypothetical protein
MDITRQSKFLDHLMYKPSELTLSWLRRFFIWEGLTTPFDHHIKRKGEKDGTSQKWRYGYGSLYG